MSLSITSLVKENGVACDHYIVTYDHEGITRTLKVSLQQLDEFLSNMAPLEQLHLLIMLWGKYRRTMSRPLTGVTIA